MSLSAIKGCEVKVRADGVVLHRHPKFNDPEGKSWHPAKEMHKDNTVHDLVDALHPEGFDKLTEQQKKDYIELNLVGKEPAWATADYKALLAKRAEKKALLATDEEGKVLVTA